jgi:acyl carrier protein
MNAIANRTQIEKIICQIIDESINELNEELPADKQLDKDPDTPLFGKSGKIDSLGLVRFIVSVEQKIEENFGDSIMLADEKAFAQKVSPFKTLGSFINYIFMLLEADIHG